MHRLIDFSKDNYLITYEKVLQFSFYSESIFVIEFVSIEYSSINKKTKIQNDLVNTGNQYFHQSSLNFSIYDSLNGQFIE